MVMVPMDDYAIKDCGYVSERAFGDRQKPMPLSFVTTVLFFAEKDLPTWIDGRRDLTAKSGFGAQLLYGLGLLPCRPGYRY